MNMQNIKEYVAAKKAALRSEIAANGYTIHVKVIQVGDDPASNAYIRGKLKDCAEVGIDCQHVHFDESITEIALITYLVGLNSDDNTDGYIVQLPLPSHISEARVVAVISPSKDIDGFTRSSLVNPATPQGIVTYLEDCNYAFDGRNALIIGRSTIVGRPLARMLLDHDMTVTVMHSHTPRDEFWWRIADLKAGDLLVAAVGHESLVEKVGDRNVVIVDVGINRGSDGKLHGDCAPDISDWQTPVPGGVGLLTRLALLTNIVKLYKINQ